jgi:hypothetical protein
MKFEIYEDFSVGGYKICFNKTFNIPFTPFLGMKIYDYHKENELTVHFDNDEYVTSEIGWCIKDKKFFGQIRHHILTPHLLKEEYNIHIKCGWNQDKYNDDIEKTIEILKANQNV